MHCHDNLQATNPLFNYGCHYHSRGCPTNPELSKSIRGPGLIRAIWVVREKLTLSCPYHTTITGTEFLLIVKSYKDMEMALALFEHSN
jgi:hypothetical protein